MNIVAIILIFLSSVIYGFYFSNKNIYKLKDYKELKKALLILEGEISFGNETLAFATNKISKKINVPINLIFENFSKEIEEDIYTDINIIWEKSVQNYEHKLYFTKNEIDEIKSFGKILYSQDADLQIKNINMLIKYLDKEIDELQVNSFKEAKMYKSISVLVSLLIVILLI